MGVNTDGEEMGQGSTITDGVKNTCGFEQETGNEKSLPQDADGDVKIQERKMAKGTRISLISSLQNIPAQHTSVVLNTEHNKAQREHTDGGDRVLSNTPRLLRPDADIEDDKTELSHGALVNLNTDTSANDKCVKLEEFTSPLLPGEIMEILETDTNDDWDAMYNTLLDEISPSYASAKLELPFNFVIDQMNKKGYTPLYKAALEGHLEDVDDLISRGANPDKPSKDGLRPLHAAAQEGHTHIVDFLILQGADVSIECELGQTPLHIAAANGYVDILESFNAEGPDLNKGDAKGLTPFNAAVQYGHLKAVEYLMTKGAKQNRYEGMTSLYFAAQVGHLDIVKFFTSHGADVNEEDDEGMIPLHAAAARGHIKVMEYLIQQGSDVNKGGAKGWTPFFDAIKEGHLEAVKYLMTEGAKQNRYDGMTPLYAAAQSGHLDIVKFFISNGADENEEDDEGEIPLHGAAIRGNVEVMEYLIQQGSNVNKSAPEGWTPFNAAVQEGHLEAVKYLMTKGAKQNRYDGITPLYVAAQLGHLDIVKLFISNGADVNEEDDEGEIPLHGAAIKGNVEVMKYLIQQGSDVNQNNNTGWTPLHSAVSNGHLEVIKVLLAKGALGTSFDGLTPLYIATQYDHIDVVNFLVSSGYDVNERNERGKSPLHAACYNGNMDIVKVLVHHNANVNEQDNDGWTPLEAAAQEGHRDVLDYLALHGADMTVRGMDGLTPLPSAENAGHSIVLEYLTLFESDTHKEDRRSCCPQGDTRNPTTRGSVVLNMRDVDTQSCEEKSTSQIGNVENRSDCTQADNAKRGANELSLKNLSARTHDDEKDAGHPNVNEYFSPLKGDPNEEDTGDPLSGGHHYGAKHLASRGYVKKKKVVEMKEVDTQSRKGQLASHVDNVEDGNDCTQADNAKRGTGELSLENLPTRTHGDEKGGNGEHSPFIHAKLKYPDKDEQGPTIDQIEAMKSPGTRKRDTISNGTDGSLPRGPQTSQYNGFVPPFLHTTETDAHPSEEPESRCHSVIDENREIGVSSSLMNAGNVLPIHGTLKELESSLTNPSDVVHQKLYDGNPVSNRGTSSNSVRKIMTKRRTSVAQCPSILAFVQTFRQMIIALAIILAGTPVLVAGSGIAERLTLQAGKPGVVPFHLQWSPRDTSQVVPFYTLRFESNPRPFSINGNVDIEGFKNPSQMQRFSTSVTDLDTFPCVNLMIDDVDTVDEDGYVLTALWHSSENVSYETIKKEVDVQIPPGRAKCFITLSENVDYPYEVHCRATSGSVTTTLSCYQNDRKIDVRGNIIDNGQVTSGIFLLPDDTYFSCCSHDLTSYVSETMCDDFVWPRGKETTRHAVNTVPTSVTTPTPQIESHTGSGACRQFMFPSLWHFTYLVVYLLAFVTI